MSEERETKGTPPVVEERSLTGSITALALEAAVTSGVGGVVGTAAVHATNKVLNRPEKQPEPPSQVVLPPGADRE